MCRLTRMVCQNGGKFERLEKILFNNIVFKAIFFRSRSHSNVHFQFQKGMGTLNLICCYLLNLPSDLDPCIDITCHYHSFCKAFGPHDARCVCANSCPSYKEPVCSSNGTTYDNRCLFEREVCLLRLNFTVQHPGSCEG